MIISGGNMHDTRTLEIKSIDVLSVFRLFSGVFSIMGLITGLFANLLRIDIMSAGVIRVFPFIAKLGPGIFVGIALGIIYGLSAGIAFSILALLYNFFAALLGGLRFAVRE
jgi:hypothetical protein